VTEVEAEEARRPWIFYYGLETSATLSTIAVALVPSFLVPLLLPAGALFLFLRLHTDKYNLLFMHPHTPSSSCRVATTTVRLLDTVVLLFQATGCAVVGTLGTNGQFIALAILLCISIAHLGCGICRSKRTRFVPAGQPVSGSPRPAVPESEGEDEASDDSDEGDIEDESGVDGDADDAVDGMDGVSSALLSSMARARARGTSLYEHGIEFEYDALGLQYPRYEPPKGLPPALGGQ
jgi:hypothetical protein